VEGQDSSPVLHTNPQHHLILVRSSFGRLVVRSDNLVDQHLLKMVKVDVAEKSYSPATKENHGIIYKLLHVFDANKSNIVYRTSINITNINQSRQQQTPC